MFNPVAFFTQYQALKGVKPETWEKLSQTWPARMAQSAWNAATLPGDVWNGKVDPLSEEGIGRATDLAGLTMSSTLASPRGSIGVGPVLPKKGLMAVEPPTPMTMTPPQGIRAYHGSPHDFDKFDISKIGTGEGAQSYGHGLYFAENPKVALDYQKKLSDATGTVTYRVGENIYERGTPEWKILGTLYNDGKRGANSLLNTYRKDAAANAPYIRDMQPDFIQRMEAALAQVNKKSDIKQNLGRMYEVNINARPDQFLDWDKPLSQQPEVFSKLGNAENLLGRLPWGSRPIATPTPSTTGGELIRPMMDTRQPQFISQQLNEAGIPGIRYLDQGSRSEGKGTFNYVVFNDALIDILKKYGIAGAAAAPVIAGAANQQEPVANY